jgi:phosphoenolpyruvate-protein phosphotransferase
MSIDIVQGESISLGLGVGPLKMVSTQLSSTDVQALVSDPRDEEDRFRQQIQELAWETEEAVRRLEADSYNKEAEILGAHLALLRDPDLHLQVAGLIHDTCRRAEHAVEQVLEGMAVMLASGGDPVMAERAADIRDLTLRLRARLEQQPAYSLTLDDAAGAIIAIHELLPTVVLKARDSAVVGFVVESGTDFSHGAILAKSFGIPVVRVDSLTRLAPYEGQSVAVQGRGQVLVEPTEKELNSLRPAANFEPYVAKHGVSSVRLWFSILDPSQLEAIEWAGIAGVGLYRSEALFLRYHTGLPSEQEQLTVYRRLFENAGEREVVFRTLDLGADKRLEHMHFGPEENPCLGLRAHRLFYFHPEILTTQIRALLQAATGRHKLSLLYPMLESIEALRFVQEIVEATVQSLVDEGLPFQDKFLQGVLIETPSAVWQASRLLEEVDFLSIGTNDLVQYLFAVDRNAANVARFYQMCHPIVFQIIQNLVEHARAAGKRLSICGEIAGDPSVLPVLVGLGVTDLSVTISSVADLRHGLSSLDEARCRELARKCIEADGVEDVHTILGKNHAVPRVTSGIASGAVVDPVCGMVVQAQDSAHVLNVDGSTYYFCSQYCRDRFAADAGLTT